MVTPTTDSSEIQISNTTALNPNMTHNDESIQSLSSPKQNPQSPKTLTLEILLPRNSNPQSEGPGEEVHKKDDVEMLSPVPQLIPEHRVFTYSRRGPTRKKLAQQRKRAALEKKSLGKLESLKKTLKPIPFTPSQKTLDFSRHEQLLKRIGLWDFVHLEFDTNIRTDLIAQLIATYNQSLRCSYVNGLRIGVNRADLSRALRLPGKKDKINVNMNVSDGSVEVPEKESEESIRFMEEIVSNWMLLHDDMWMMPEEVLKTTKMIKDGNFEKIDLTSLLWYMVEKELLAPQLGHCYYASHMQCLIQCQKKELLLTDEVKEEVEEDCDGDVKMVDRFEDVKLEEDKIELILGQDNIVDSKENIENDLKENVGNELKDNVDNDLKDNVENDLQEDVGNDSKENAENNLIKNIEKEEKEFVADENVISFHDNKKEQQLSDEKKINFEGNKKEEEDGQWFSDKKTNVDENEHILRSCTVDEIKDMSFHDDDEEGEGEEEEEEGYEEEEEEEKEKKDTGYKEEEKKQDIEEGEEEGGEQEEETEEEQQEEEQFSTARGETLEMVTSANLIQGMEAAQVPFRSEVHICDDDLPGDFLVARVGNNAVPGGSSHFVNGNKREMVHDNELSHHSLNGGNKRLRSVGSWDNKSSSEYYMCMDQLQHLMGKARMLYEAKEQACEESSMNQQILLTELQKRDSMIEILHKAKYEVEQKRQLEVYRLERELYFMGNLLDGYKKILKETRKEFAEYRACCPQLDEPLYKDVHGGAGLVLTAVELEKQRMKQEEEVRMNKLLIEKKVKDFEGEWIAKFEAHKDNVQLMYNRLLDIEDQVKPLKEFLAKQKVSETSECAPNELSGQ